MVTKVDIKDYEMLLDSLQMAGICVIEEDGHNVLYFNKRIKEIIPGIEAGRQLRELWTGCPLPDMHDKKEKRIVYNSSSLGIPMEITVIKKMWKGIPSLVITAASHKESDSLTYHMENVVRGMHEKESRCIINSLSSLYFATYYVDLEKGIFRVVTQRDEVGDILGEEINYNEGLTAYSYHFVHPESREEYMKKLNLERLRGILDEKHPFEAVEYRRINSFFEILPPGDKKSI